MIEVIQLKEASEGALADINKLLPQLRNGSPGPEGTLQELKSMMSDPNVVILAARDEEKIIAMAVLYIMQKFGKRSGQVESVVVDRAYRGKQLGKKIMDELIEAARSNGVSQLNLTSNPTRIAAHKLYESLGFVQRDTDVYKLTIE